jgi:hypothetical protein
VRSSRLRRDRPLARLSHPLAQRRRERVGSRESVCRHLRERPEHRGFDGGGHRVPHGSDSGWFLGEESGDDGLGGATLEGRFPREHLVDHYAQREEVGPRRKVVSTRGLLRAHVLRGAHRKSAVGEPIACGLPHRQRDAEVGQHRLAFVKQDVLRLDVAMNDTQAVGVVERTGHLACNAHHFLDRQLLLGPQPLPQGFAADEWEHVV